MAKIAVELGRALAQREASGAAGCVETRTLAKGSGWRVADVVCTSGRHDRRFEERHEAVSIAMVVAGCFQYRAACGAKTKNEVMTPGSLLLGGFGQCFECGHEHGSGDRCISFWYAPEYFERIASDAGAGHAKPTFCELRVPALRELSPLVTNACLGVLNSAEVAWEELGLKLAALTVRLANGLPTRCVDARPGAQVRMARVVRMIDAAPQAAWSVEKLAGSVGLSPYHFLRTFEQVTGVTPHQYLMRIRLRDAGIRIASEPENILDVALDSGFGDVSNFNRAFGREFGVSPRAYRKQFSS